MNNRRFILNLLAALVLVIAVLPGFFQVAQSSGGPDEGGYIYEDSNDPGGPVYFWEDISTTGTAVSLSNDAMSGTISLPFTFQYYGVDYTQLYISSNGFLTFLSGQSNDNSPATIPTAGNPDAIIAGYWADLIPSASGASVHYATAGVEPDRRFIIQFTAVPHYPNLLTNNPVTFEFKLFERTNIIEIHYNSMTTDGDPHTVGIENAGGSAGLQYYNGIDPIDNALAVRFQRFVGVALRPSYEILYGEAGTTLTFNQRISNWTDTATTFSLATTDSPAWPTTVTMTGDDFRTVPMAEGESRSFTVAVNIPAAAQPGDSSQFDLTVTQDGGSYQAASTMFAAVPRLGFGLGYYDISETDSESGILQIDTKFHNSLHQPVSANAIGQYINYGAITPDGQELWVVDAGSTNAYAMDVNDLSSYTPITVGNEASDVAFTPDGRLAVISSYAADNVSLVDTTTKSVITTLATADRSVKVDIGACFPRKAYVTNYGGNSVSVIDLGTKTVKTTITGFNRPMGIVVSPKTNRAFVANSGTSGANAGTIMVIDTLTDTWTSAWNVGGDSMAGIAISPDGERLYATSNGTVKVVDADTGDVLASIPSPIDKLWDIEVFPAGMGDFAYVTSNNSNYTSIVVIDTLNNQVVKEIIDGWAVKGLALFPSRSTCNVAPVASFTPVNAIGRVNQEVSWINTTIYGATSYFWEFGDGATSTDEHPTHTYTGSGPYTVKLTATNANGSSDSSGTVNFAPVAGFTPTNSAIYAGDAVTFTNTTTGTDNNMTYSWNFGDGATSSETSPTYTYTTIGDYTVSLTATNAFGTSTATGKVDFAPVAGFTPLESIIRPGEQVAFTNASTGTNTTASPLTYSWNFGDGTTSTEANPTHTFAGTADVVVRMTAHNGFGTDSTQTGSVKFKPRAQFSPSNTNVITGTPLSFTNQSAGPGPFTYNWDFGDNSGTSSAENPTHTYTADGSYNVTLTVTNSNGSDSTIGTIKTAVLPVARFTQSASVININDTVSFSNTSTGTEPLSYSWDFGDGSPLSSEKNPSHQYAAAGNYTVTLSVTNIVGNSTSTSQVMFFATAAFSPTSSTIQTGDTITFTNHSTGSTPLTYTWDFGDGSAASTAESPSHQYTTAGSYTVKLTAHNAFGPDSIATGTVVFRPKAVFTPENSIIHVGDTVAFTNQTTGTGSISYTWNFGDGTETSTAVNPSHQYTTAGAYTVTLTATSADYGSHSTTGTVLFAPTASFSPGTNVIQMDDTVQFTNNSVGTNTSTYPLTYTWDFGDGSPTSTAANPSHQYTKAGSYTIRLTAHNGLGTDSVAIGTVVFKPKAAFTPASSVIHEGDSISFTNQSTGTGALTYVWDFGDGSPTSTATNPSHTYPTAGSYIVTLTATSATYGSHSTSGEVVFAPTAGFSPANSIIQTGDSITFTNSSVGTDTNINPLTYEWDFGDGSPTSTGKNPVHLYTTAGNYTVRLTAHNGLGTDSVATGTVVFRPKAAFNPSNSIIQAGDTVTFTNQTSGTGTISYDWDFGDGSSHSTVQHPSHQYPTVGVYTVTLTSTSSLGDHTATGQVVFAPTAKFTPTGTPAEPIVIQLGDRIQFTNQSIGTGDLHYTWDFGDGTPEVTTANPSHVYQKAGAYTINMKAENAYGSQTATATVVFTPTAAFDLAKSIIHLGEELVISNLSTGTGPLTYDWDFGDNTPISHEANPTHTFVEVGRYVVTLTVTNPYGKAVTTWEIVANPYQLFVPVIARK